MLRRHGHVGQLGQDVHGSRSDQIQGCRRESHSFLLSFCSAALKRLPVYFQLTSSRWRCGSLGMCFRIQDQQWTCWSVGDTMKKLGRRRAGVTAGAVARDDQGAGGGATYLFLLRRTTLQSFS